MPFTSSHTKPSPNAKSSPRFFLGELKARSLWFIRLRWGAPPAILIAAGLAFLCGYRINPAAVIAAAGLILAGNTALWGWSREMAPDAWQRPERLQYFIYWQLCLDFGVILLLIHFTGGIHSRLLYLSLIPILFAASILPRRSAWAVASTVVAGVALITIGAHREWIAWHPVTAGPGPGISTTFADMALNLFFFAATVSITAFLSITVMRVFFRRVQQLATKSDSLAAYNQRFNTLFSMVKAIGAIRQLDRVLETATHEVAMVMDVKAISVKLLSEDGKHLAYRGSYGLPPEFVKKRLIAVAESPLNQRIIKGEPFVTGDLGRHEMFQFGEDLAFARIRSVLFVPIAVEDRVMGVLGAYCILADRFTETDIEFFRLTAGLVGIGIDNSRAYEAIETFTAERSRFMLRVAHNLRAPLAAVLSMLELLREQHLGALNENQAEYLRRVDRRTRTMLDMINELLTLSTSRTVQERPEKKALGASWLAGRLERTFHDEAAERGVALAITVADDTPVIMGDAGQIEQMLENLVSNAIKYTPAGGRVNVAFSASGTSMVTITVTDSGIGIPEAEMPRLFSEFFRAANAREKEDLGTGLGLAIVKDIVDTHHGQITVDSREGQGTTFAVSLPAGEDPKK